MDGPVSAAMSGMTSHASVLRREAMVISATALAICHAGYALDDSGACVAFSAPPNAMIQGNSWGAVLAMSGTERCLPSGRPVLCVEMNGSATLDIAVSRINVLLLLHRHMDMLGEWMAMLSGYRGTGMNA